MILSLTLGGLALLSMLLTLWQVLVAMRFPLHQRLADPRFCPPVTLLKPLKGCEATSRECLLSWLTQRYPAPVQILFGVASPLDPICEVVRSLLAEHPHVEAELIICPEQLGANAKVSQLIQMERRASHEVIGISDADVWVPPEFLGNALSHLEDPAVGLVHSLYRLTNESTWAMRWEALSANADFWSQVLQAVSLRPANFALGAAMFTTRRQLKPIGGLAVLEDYLADDYQLGHRLASQGARIALCPVVVECRSDTLSFGQVWAHQLRWARTVRVCEPGPFFFSILSNATFWPLLWLGLCPSAASGMGAILALLFRAQTARQLETLLTGRVCSSGGGMPWCKDLLQVLVWGQSFMGREVVWRGGRYRVRRGGKLERGVGKKVEAKMEKKQAQPKE